jgi:hypothetical protein
MENAIFKNDVYHSVYTDEIFRHAGILHCSQRLDGGSVMIVFAVCLFGIATNAAVSPRATTFNE